MIFSKVEGKYRAFAVALLIAAIALIDSRVDAPIAFGFLYLLPILLVGTTWDRWHVVGVALLCTLLCEAYNPHGLNWGFSLPQDVLIFAALAGTGLFAHEITASRRRERQHLEQVQRESIARRAAEEQLEFLIDSSPAAIFTTDSNGIILQANSAAHRLLGVSDSALPGRSIDRYFPALARVPLAGATPQAFRTEMQCRGERENREVFLANVFFSTYKTAMGPRLAALAVDASEELRDREESSLDQMLAGSRILVSAVWHEIRNVCGAIAINYTNMARDGALAEDRNFEAMGALVETLGSIASLELRQSSAEPRADTVELAEILDDVRIVLEPYCRDAGIALEWRIPPSLPAVWADRHRLMQAVLNLVRNSERALEDADKKRISIQVTPGPRSVSIRFTDSGPGIADSQQLFVPFQKGAESSGLGLYISRAFLRSFRGDLRYDPGSPGCSFLIELALAGSGFEEDAAGPHATHTPAAAR